MEDGSAALWGWGGWSIPPVSGTVRTIRAIITCCQRFVAGRIGFSSYRDALAGDESPQCLWVLLEPLEVGSWRR